VFYAAYKQISVEMIRLRLRNLWLKRGADMAAISAISIFFFMIFFWRAIFGSASIILGDPLSYSYPLWTASLHDSSSRRSTPFSAALGHWQTVYLKDGVRILSNVRDLPRACLVTEAVSIDKPDAWAAIRDQSDRTFDPRRTALLEPGTDKMPALSGHPLSDDSYARIITYEPNRLVLETKTEQPAVLVVSEMNYPGWVATIDGEYLT